MKVGEIMSAGEFKLCYIKDNFAYFTTQDLKDQDGDGWDEIPYEYKAGEPYKPGLRTKNIQDSIFGKLDSHSNKEEDSKWDILKLAFDGYFETPKDDPLNNKYSVEDINAGAVAWLTQPWKNINIFAGTTLGTFIKLIKRSGGNVYTKIP